ncbi:MAG: hypothetical protein RIS86_2195 [Planctomycetota bacterium]|jgi:hypothetical protein
MRITLDDFETTLQARTVGAALEEAAGIVGRNGRMIVEVEVDGAAWTEEDLANPEFASRPAGELRIGTAHPAELLRDTFAHAAEAVLNAEEIQRNAAKLLQANRTREGFDGLLQALAIWGSAQTAVSRGLELGVLSRESVGARGIDLDGAIAALDARLRTLRDAMAAADQTAVSDCLLYEFPETSRRFAKLLADLAGEAARVVGN